MFHVSTLERKELFEWKSSVLLERGKGTCDFREEYMFHVSTLKRKVNASYWVESGLDWSSWLYLTKMNPFDWTGVS